MGRIWLLAALAYAYGNPDFDNHRPQAFDRPLREFHRTVDAAGVSVTRFLVSIDDRSRTLVRDIQSLHQLSDVLP